MVGFVDADGLRVMVDGNVNGAVEGQLNALAGNATTSETVFIYSFILSVFVFLVC